MGEIKQQSIRGTFFTYGGAILGFVISGILFPKLLSTDQIGLINVLIAYAIIFSQVASLGFISTTTRMFPFFRNFKKKHNGFLHIAISITTVGFIMAIFAFFMLKGYMIEGKSEDSKLLGDYIFLLLPLIFSILYFNILDHYNKVLFNAVRGIIYKEFTLRLFIILIIILLSAGLFSFKVFIHLYVLCYFIPLILIIAALINEKQFNLVRVKGFVDKDLSKTMVSVSLFGVISSATGIVTISIDKIMVNELVGMSATGIYTTCFFFGTLVILPSRALLKTASTYIADAWKTSDISTLKSIYQKSALFQFLIGILTLIGIWVNIDNIMVLLGDSFLSGRYVILYIGIAYLIDMLSGASAVIINISKHYRVQSIFMGVLILLVVLTNYIFIPIYGLVGAAIASLIAKIIYNLLNFVFVFIKFKMQPYNIKFIIVALAGIFSYFIASLMPEFDNFIVDILVRSSIVSIVYISLCYLLNIDHEFNDIINKIYRRVFIRK